MSKLECEKTLVRLYKKAGSFGGSSPGDVGITIIIIFHPPLLCFSYEIIKKIYLPQSNNQMMNELLPILYIIICDFF
jgi:hypothetical protein